MPAPVARGVRVFSIEGGRHVNATSAAGDVLAVDFADPLEVEAQGLLQACRKDGAALAHAFARADDDLVIAEVHVLDPQPQ